MINFIVEYKWVIGWATAWVIGFGIKFYLDRRAPKKQYSHPDESGYKFEGTGPKDG